MKRGPLGAGTLLIVSLATVLLMFAQPVSAEEEGPTNLPDRFMLRGVYLYVFGADTNILLNGPAGFGTGIDYERTLNGITQYSGFESMLRIASTNGIAWGFPIIVSCILPP